MKEINHFPENILMTRDLVDFRRKFLKYVCFAKISRTYFSPAKGLAKNSLQECAVLHMLELFRENLT